MMSKTLAVQMPLVGKLESLINMRSLMVMICILSVSVKAKRSSWKPWTIPHEDCGEQKFQERKNKTKWEWMFGRNTASRNWLIALSLVLLAAIFYPTQEGIMCTDAGASQVIRFAVVIPGSVLLVGAFFVALSRYQILQKSGNAEEYNENVRNSNHANNTLLATNITMLIALIVVCLVATQTFDEDGNHIHKPQSILSIVLLSSFSILGFASWLHSTGKVDLKRLICHKSAEVTPVMDDQLAVENKIGNMETGPETEAKDEETASRNKPEKGGEFTDDTRRRLCQGMNM